MFSNLPDHFELIMTRDADLTQRTLKSYNTILDIVYGGNQIVTRTHKGPGQGESRSFVVVTPTSLCLQCQAGTAIADVAGHHSFKKHAFCKISHARLTQQTWLTHVQKSLIQGQGVYTVRCARMSCTIQVWSN